MPGVLENVGDTFHLAWEAVWFESYLLHGFDQKWRGSKQVHEI